MKIPYYAIAASLPPGNRLSHFHGDHPDSATYLLLHIPRFRWAGFDLSIAASPTPGPDDSLELKSGDRKLLRLYQDGTLLFRCRADYDFLGWGTEPNVFERLPKLNPVAVTEVHASFVHFYTTILARVKKPTEQVTFHLSLKNGAWNGQRLFLTRYYESGGVDWNAVPRYPLQERSAEADLLASLTDVSAAPDRVAYRLLAEFISWFDMPPEELSFIRHTPAGREIDIDALKKLR